MALLTLLLILGGILVGFAVGSNNTANCLGTSVGAGIINYKKAVYIVAIFAFLGASLQGRYTISKIGKGIIEPSLLAGSTVVLILFTVGFLVLLLSILGLPVSTTSAILGALGGIGFITKVPVSWKDLGIIFGVGFLSPIIAAILSYGIYKLYILTKVERRFIWFEKFLKGIILLSGAFLAYSFGANDIGNAMGLVVGRGILTPLIGGILGGLALSIGAVTFGRKVINTVGNGITQLDATMAFASQFGAGLAVYLLTLFSIPTSTSFAIIGGIAGVGIVKGISTVNFSTLRHIVIGWVATPILSAILSIFVFKIIETLI